MATKIIPWPVFVDHVVYKKGTRTKNEKEIETETYLVYIKKSKMQLEQPIPLALYKGTHDGLIQMFLDGEWEDAGEDKLLTPTALKNLCIKRAKEWEAMSDDEKLLTVTDMDVTIPRSIMKDEAKQKAFVENYRLQYANMPSRLRTEYAQNEPENGDFGVIFGNLPIDGTDGNTQFYVLNKGGYITNQKGEKVTQTHDRVCAMVKRVDGEWQPIGDASSFEEALRNEVLSDINRNRFEKVETQEEALARLSAALGVTPATETPTKEAPTAETPEETPTETPAKTPAEETPATT